MKEYLPYIVSLLLAIISGLTTWAVTRKQAKNDIEKIVKQHEVDIESLERQHSMELEKMSMEHTHQLELQKNEMEANLGTSFISEFIKMPEFRQQLSRGIKKKKKIGC